MGEEKGEREREACLQERVVDGRPELPGDVRTEYLSSRPITVMSQGEILLKVSWFKS